MKWRTIVILLFIFLALLFTILYLEKREERKEKFEGKLVTFSTSDINKVELKRGIEEIVFQKKDDSWEITAPLKSKADKYTVDRLIEDFSDLKIERKVEENPRDLKKYGLEPPHRILKLWKKDGSTLTIYTGIENPIDGAIYAKKPEENTVYLIPSFLKSGLDKTLFDFRNKKIFEFEKDKVTKIKWESEGKSWEVTKKEDEWFLEQPVRALADKGKIDDLLYSLSGAEAKSFEVEDYKDEQLKDYFLEKPKIKISIKGEKDINISVGVKEEKDKKSIYAISNLNRIISELPETFLSEIDKKPEDVREKSVAVFWSFDVKSFSVIRDGKEYYFEKDKQDKWEMIKPERKEMDGTKINDFLRKIEDVEAKEFIDNPKSLKDYGLDKPSLEFKIKTKEREKEKLIEIVVGKEENERVHLMNKKLNYIFVTDNSFLKEIPKDFEDWKKK
ncbi:MAG: DUF4340 domain-containing protein [Candidatus Aminicenantia bacterium]